MFDWLTQKYIEMVVHIFNLPGGGWNVKEKISINGKRNEVKGEIVLNFEKDDSIPCDPPEEAKTH